MKEPKIKEVKDLEDACEIALTKWLDHEGIEETPYHVYKYLRSRLTEEKEKAKNMYHPHTQKGKGLNELFYNGYGFVRKHFESEVMYAVVRPADAFTSIVTCSSYTYPMFARPCPLVPRHGFVDSRVVNSPGELVALAEETLREEPEAEIALMDYVDSSYNAIVQPGRLTIGPGNDGATAGHNSVTFMLKGDGGLNDYSPLIQNAGIKNSPYFEVVYHKEDWVKPTVVQLRDGPVLPNSIDYVPRETLVTKVIKVNGEDLLDWERIIKENAGVEGVVVWHPGGAMSSHYSIHAVIAKIPVLISFEPKVGDVLAKIEDSEAFDINWKELKSGFVGGIVDNTIEMENAFKVVLAIGKSLKNPDSYILGYGMGLSYRLSLVASMGERRHLHKKQMSRDIIFERVWKDSAKYKHRMVKLYEDFTTKSWNHGYGGKAWGSIAKYAYDLYNSVTHEDAANVLFAFNNLVDAHHNNNWFGDKFISVDSFKFAGFGYYGSAVNVAPILYSLVKNRIRYHWTWKSLKALHDATPLVKVVKENNTMIEGYKII